LIECDRRSWQWRVPVTFYRLIIPFPRFKNTHPGDLLLSELFVLPVFCSCGYLLFWFYIGPYKSFPLWWEVFLCLLFSLLFHPWTWIFPFCLRPVFISWLSWFGFPRFFLGSFLNCIKVLFSFEIVLFSHHFSTKVSGLPLMDLLWAVKSHQTKCTK